MADDLAELGLLADVNLAGAWANLGGHGGEVGGTEACPFVATASPMGVPIYERIGYRRLGNYIQLAHEPA